MTIRAHTLWLGLLLGVASGCQEVAVQEAATGQTLDFAYYRDNVDPLFNKERGGKVCASSGCHSVEGGSGGAFKVYADAETQTQLMANFFSAKSFANLADPSRSKLLLEPLSGTFSITGSHTGGDIFPNTADPDYQTILTWISTPVSF